MLLSLIATTFMFSCKQKEEQPDVIVIEQPAQEQPVSTEEPVVAPVENNDGTSIAVDENGVQINSEKTSVDVSGNKAKIEVKE